MTSRMKCIPGPSALVSDSDSATESHHEKEPVVLVPETPEHMTKPRRLKEKTNVLGRNGDSDTIRVNGKMKVNGDSSPTVEGHGAAARKRKWQEKRVSALSRLKLKRARNSIHPVSSSESDCDSDVRERTSPSSRHRLKYAILSSSESENDADSVRMPPSGDSVPKRKADKKPLSILSSSDSDSDLIVGLPDCVPSSTSRRQTKICSTMLHSPKWRKKEQEMFGSSDESDTDSMPLSHRVSGNRHGQNHYNVPLSERLVTKSSQHKKAVKIPVKSSKSVNCTENGAVDSPKVVKDGGLVAFDAQIVEVTQSKSHFVSGQCNHLQKVHSMSDSDEELNVTDSVSNEFPETSNGFNQPCTVQSDPLLSSTSSLQENRSQASCDRHTIENDVSGDDDPWLKFLRGCRQDSPNKKSGSPAKASRSRECGNEVNSLAMSALGESDAPIAACSGYLPGRTELGASSDAADEHCMSPGNGSRSPQLRYKSTTRQCFKLEDSNIKNKSKNVLEKKSHSRQSSCDASATVESDVPVHSNNIILLSDTDDSTDIDEETLETIVRNVTRRDGRPAITETNNQQDSSGNGEAVASHSSHQDSQNEVEEPASDYARSMWDIFGSRGSSRPAPVRKRRHPHSSIATLNGPRSRTEQSVGATSAGGSSGYFHSGRDFYRSRRPGANSSRMHSALHAASSSSLSTVSNSAQQKFSAIEVSKAPSPIRAKSSRILQNKSKRRPISSLPSQDGTTPTVPGAGGEVVEVVRQLDADEAFARQLQEEMDREFAASLASRTTPSPPASAQGGVPIIDGPALWNPYVRLPGSRIAHSASVLPPMVALPDFMPVSLGEANSSDVDPPPTRPTRPSRRRNTRASAAAVASRRGDPVTNLETHLAELQSELDMLMAIGAMSEGDLPEHMARGRNFAMPRGRARPAARRGRRARAISQLDETFGDGESYEALLALSEMIGNVVADSGLSTEQINRLPTEDYKKRAGAEPFECHVCMCEAETGDKLRLLPCLHKFHSACIDKWIKDHPTCPVCREKVEC